MNTLGRRIVDFAPGPDNPRNSEGAFIRLRDGRILFVYSRFVGEYGGDEAPAHIVARYSADEGETWSGERILFRREDFGAANIMSASLLRMQDGALGLFFIVRMSWYDARLHLFVSHDEGETFGAGTCCIPGKGYYVTNNDRVIRTRSGRILVPGNMHRLKNEPSDGIYPAFDERGFGFFFYSDDDGRTWTEAADVLFPPSNKIAWGIQETGVVELAHGALWSYSRSTGGAQLQSFSLDDGETWTDPAPSRFTSPCSPMQMKRLRDGRLLAVWNPVPSNNVRPFSFSWNRTPLVVAASADEGKTWSEARYLEDGSEDAGYSYPAVFAETDYVLVAYCAGSRQDGSDLYRLRIRKLPIEELQ